MWCSCCCWHAGCARIVLNDAGLNAGKAHLSVITVFEELSASEEMKTVQGMNANNLFIFNHGVIGIVFVHLAFSLDQ